VNEVVVPRSLADASGALAAAAAGERAVRIVGGGTKLGWGFPAPPRALRLQTTHLDRVRIAPDLQTATLQAGTTIVQAQATLARSGVMFAADPHLGLSHGSAATVGGVFATADSGPLSHRYGSVREQALGLTAALGDGRLVHTGPLGQDRQHGCDLTRLLVGSFGTLGAILAVDVRLHPLPGGTATALAATADASRLASAARTLSDRHPDLEALDLAWRGGRGGILARVAGEDADARATEVAVTMRECGLAATEVRADDGGLWSRQRAGQRSARQAVIRVDVSRGNLAEALALADTAAATVVGRAAQGILYLTLDVAMIAVIRAGMPVGAPAVVLDLPAASRGAIDPWGVAEGPALELMRELKTSFDPAGICNPGVFVGRI
jgi:glycolate oxidase FAD binding subunit